MPRSTALVVKIVLFVAIGSGFAGCGFAPATPEAPVQPTVVRSAPEIRQARAWWAAAPPRTARAPSPE